MKKSLIVERSFIVPAIEWIVKLLSWGSIYNNTLRLMRRKGKWTDEELIPFWFAEVYSFTFLLLLALAFSFVPVRSCLWWICVVLAGYRLFDVGEGLAVIIVFHRQRRQDDQGGYILVRTAIRWVLLTVMNLIEIIICFSFCYLTWGTQFKPLIETRLSAIYQSFTTLVVAGGSTPASDIARVITMLELTYFVFFLIIVVPVVLSVIRAKERTSQIFGKDVGPDKIG